MITTLILPWSLKQWVKHNHSSSNTMISSKIVADTCNALLRGELSAIETYTRAIEKFGPDAEDGPLQGIRADHVVSAESLRSLVGERGRKPAASSGPWGRFATTVGAVAILFGKSPALMVLAQGEEHGIRQYEKALDDDKLSETVKALIRETLLPALRGHLVALERCKMNAA